MVERESPKLRVGGSIPSSPELDELALKIIFKEGFTVMVSPFLLLTETFEMKISQNFFVRTFVSLVYGDEAFLKIVRN